MIGIDGSLLIAQLAGALAAFAGFRALLGAFAGSQVAPAALGLALAFVQMLAWQYVEVPLLVLLPVWLLPLLEWTLRSKPWIQRWALLILLAGGGGRTQPLEGVAGSLVVLIFSIKNRLLTRKLPTSS